MRIALLHNTLPPVIGGVEKVMGMQARALADLGHEVLLLDRSGMRESGASFDVAIVHNVFTMPFDLGWTRELRALAAADRSRLWFNWVHDVAAMNPYYAHLPWDSPELAPLREAPANTVHVAVSESRRRDFANATGIDAGLVRVIPNGVDAAEVLGLTKLVASLRPWRRGLVIFHPARLLRRKNIELGVKVCAALRAEGCDAVYIVSGAPDPHQADGARYLEELRGLATELGVSSEVLFLGDAGALDEADVRSLYTAADCLFFPSRGEGFGLPLLEGVLHRTPIFCSDLPVHHEAGITEGMTTFDPGGDPGEVAKMMLKWAAQAHAMTERKRIWREYDMAKICQERLEPLLRIR